MWQCVWCVKGIIGKPEKDQSSALKETHFISVRTDFTRKDTMCIQLFTVRLFCYMRAIDNCHAAPKHDPVCSICTISFFEHLLPNGRWGNSFLLFNQRTTPSILYDTFNNSSQIVKPINNKYPLLILQNVVLNYRCKIIIYCSKKSNGIIYVYTSTINELLSGIYQYINIEIINNCIRNGRYLFNDGI